MTASLQLRQHHEKRAKMEIPAIPSNSQWATQIRRVICRGQKRESREAEATDVNLHLWENAGGNGKSEEMSSGASVHGGRMNERSEGSSESKRTALKHYFTSTFTISRMIWWQRQCLWKPYQTQANQPKQAESRKERRQQQRREEKKRKEKGCRVRSQ